MDIEQLRDFCLKLPGTIEDVKWGNDLCFCVSEKMYCVTGLSGAFGVSLKCTPDDFDRLTAQENIRPARYLARYKWIHISENAHLSDDDWQSLIKKSYDLVVAKLPKKLRP